MKPKPPTASERAITVSAEVVTFVGGGGRDVDTEKSPELAALPAGEKLRLMDPRGAELALALADPDNKKLRVMAVRADGFPSIDGALMGWRVEKALQLRRLFGLVPDPKATGEARDVTYRILHGAGDGVPGFTCDVLGRFGVLYVYAPALLPTARLLAEAVRGFAQLEGVVIKVRARGGASDVAQEVVGKTPPDAYVAYEHGVPFEIHPLGGLNVGLFTDMREQRRGLPRFVAGKRVLNLFSYTGALSVACARAGAASVTSVDTAEGVQAWARGNFARSGFDTKDKRFAFEQGDAQRYLVRAAKEKERYDVILCDPPTFSPARGTPWVLDRDYPELIAQCCEVIPEGGLLWLAANTHELGSLTRLAHKGFRAAGRTATILEQGGLPPDYPTSAAQVRDRYLQIALFRIS